MSEISKKVTYTILSMSLLTVMAGAAIAPALGIIKQHFASYPPLSVQLIVSIPALFIIATNLFFFQISRRFDTRSIAVTGLSLYVLSGAGCFFADNIYTLLCLRAVLGVSVGLIMPLSTGLLSFYFPPERQAQLMGLSAAMNQLGGLVATLLAGVLAAIEWRYAFLVYLLGLIAVVMVVCNLPAERLSSHGEGGKAFDFANLARFHPSVTGMLLLMIVFFVFPTNFAITAQASGLSIAAITLCMVGLDLVAFLVGLVFGKVMRWFRRAVKYFAPTLFLLGYLCYCAGGAAWLIAGSCLIGLANGVGVPYLNTIASIKGGKNSATTVMPLLSAALYLGQFISPILVSPLANWLFGEADTAAPYKVAIIISAVFLAQVFLTRSFQSLPPEDRPETDKGGRGL